MEDMFWDSDENVPKRSDLSRNGARQQFRDPVLYDTTKANNEPLVAIDQLPSKRSRAQATLAARIYNGPQGPLEAQQHRRREEEEAEGIHEPDYQCPLCWLHIENPLDDEESKCLRYAYEVLYENLQNVALDQIYVTMANRFNETVVAYHQGNNNRELKLKEWTLASVRYHIEECSLEYKGIMYALREREHLYYAQRQLWRTRCFYVEPPALPTSVEEEEENFLGSRGNANQPIMDEKSFDRYMKTGQRIDQLTRHIQVLLNNLMSSRSGDSSDTTKTGQKKKTKLIGSHKISPDAQIATQRLTHNITRF